MNTLDLEAGLDLHPQVSVRPEAFGALLYHFGTRRLSFLKDPKLLEVVRQLPTSTSVREACVEAGVDPVDMPRYCQALATLVDTQMLTPRGRASQTNGSGQ
jgi:mycofactocin biosynthesis protein MftB